MHAGEMCTCQVARTLITHESRCTLWRVFGRMAGWFLAKVVLGPPHYHDTFQTCQTWRVGVCMLARCARAKSHALSPHTSRDAPCGVCLGVCRVVFWPSWCLVHHTTMTPFKRARCGEWAYACWRDVHCQVARTLTTHESRCTLWRVFGSMACCFLAKLVLGPPHYHDPFQTCQTWRVGVCMLARCARATRRTHTHHTRVEMHLVACVWEYGVLFF